MVFLQLLLLTLLTAVAAIFLWFKRVQVYWEKGNVPWDRNSLYYFGRGRHLAYFIQDIYKRFQNCGSPFVGLFVLFSPTVLLLDLDLIKRVFVSDFDSFPDRNFYHNVRDDPLSGSILRLEGEEWKRLRAKLTPTFSSSKMKFMFATVVAVGDRFVELMHDLVGQQSEELEIRDLCARFTTDVIGSVAFGIECNSMRDPRTEFRLKGDKAFGSFNIFREKLGTKFPRLFHFFRVTAFPQDLIDFYSRIVTENIEYRERNQIRRNDFLDILISLKNTKVDDEFVLTLKEIIGQAFIFFIGGFETSSTTMTYCLFELTHNPEVQEKARQDVLENLSQHNNDLSYECLRDMRYLEQVFLETLRKYPVAPNLKRMTRRDYPVPNTSHTIEKGLEVIIPVYAIHHNSDYYPDPEKFDPDRFAAAQLQQRNSMAYLPFGAGPRMCIAERFGKMQTMIGLAILLKNFKFTATQKTPTFLDFDSKEIRILSVKEGIHLNVERLA